jgi:hypothetical protein
MGEAHDPLADVPAAEAFRTCNGVVLNNTSELATYLAGCSEYDFRYHVNQDHHKNDFAIWVRESVKDEPLAHELDSEMNKEFYLHKVQERLHQLTGSVRKKKR